MQNSSLYERLIEQSIYEFSQVLGPQMAIIPARDIPGLEVSDEGVVLELEGDGKEVLARLLDRYVDIAGEVPLARIGRVIQDQYDISRIDLPENLEETLKELPVESVLDQLDDGIVVTDAEYRVVKTNATAERILSPGDGRVAGHDLEAVASISLPLSPDSPEDEEGPTGQAPAADVETPEAVTLPDAEGGDSLATRFVRAVTGLSGTLVRSLRNGTAEDQLEAPVDRIIDQLNDGIIVTDAELRIVDYNRTVKRLLQPGGKSLLDRSVTEVLPPAHARRLQGVEGGNRYVTDGGEDELLTVEDDDEERFFDVTVSTLFDRGDVVQGYALVYRDVTTLERTRRRLENRTDQLERQNEQLDQFASIVSHDLRNPLNVAEAALHTAEETGDYEEALEEIEVSLDRMHDIIEDVLTMSRTGKAVEEFEASNLESVVLNAWSTVDTEDCELELHDSATIMCDRSRVQRIFENLLRNSVEHAGTDLTIDAGVLESADEVEGFYYQDDGPGIPESEMDDVLEVGYTTSETGTGLGLGIVTQIAEAHGWDVAVSNGPTGGARFEVTGVSLPERRLG